jgi:hypothetical protein
VTHYTREGPKERSFELSGKRHQTLSTLRLKTSSQWISFHSGGLEATRQRAAPMELRPGLSLLESASGVDGPARCLADRKSI